MDEYKQYLAQKILTEDQVITYRLLSRALKVRVNTAKEMLYDFHKWQNDKRPGTLHATYIIYGTKARPEHQDGDLEMTDSQASQTSDDMDFPLSDLVPTYTLTLATQEQLQETMSQYSEVACIHVYSLAPHPLKDLQLLADTASQVRELSTTDNETLGSGKVYGSITNLNVRKREAQRGPISAAKARPSNPIPAGSTTKQNGERSATTAVREESKVGSRATSKPLVASGVAKKPASVVPLKRQGSSGIGQMFAKAAANPKKPSKSTSESPATSAAASGVEDNQKTEAMSDDGEDDMEPMADVKYEDNNAARESRRARQAKLRRMMEESDAEEEAEEAEEEPTAEEPSVLEPEPKPEPGAEEPAEVISSTSGGRRRGRRRVMRKKQTMDENGYLVTSQEPGWESFSEEEAPSPPPEEKAKLVKAAPAAKPKKGAAKGAQGNIMSFFSKK
ncbi:DNA polymerase subunit Cdc27 [Xylaria intraflava]|nr:DNA polymerase subunit Cdc27 [Xylaria intraflava]